MFSTEHLRSNIQWTKILRSRREKTLGVDDPTVTNRIGYKSPCDRTQTRPIGHDRTQIQPSKRQKVQISSETISKRNYRQYTLQQALPQRKYPMTTIFGTKSLKVWKISITAKFFINLQNFQKGCWMCPSMGASLTTSHERTSNTPLYFLTPVVWACCFFMW